MHTNVFTCVKVLYKKESLFRGKALATKPDEADPWTHTGEGEN